MPSRDPLDTMIETFSIVGGRGTAGCGCSSRSVIVSSRWSVVTARRLDAASRLGDAGDLRGKLGRALGEQLIQLLDRDARRLAERSNRRRRAVLLVGAAHEVDDSPVPVGQLGDATL